MSILDRIILTVYMLLMVVVSLFLIVIPFGLIPSNVVGMAVDMVSSNWYYLLVGLVLLVVSIKLLLSGVSSGKKTRGGVIKASEFGEIRISMETFESLGMKVVKQISGVRDAKVRVDIGEAGLIVFVRLLVLPDVNIPKTMSDVQGSIKSYIESITEVLVKEVKVEIQNIAQTNIPRVS